MKMGRPVLCITEDIVDRANERTMREVVYYRKGIAIRIEEDQADALNVSVRYGSKIFHQSIEMDEIQDSFGKAYRK